MGTDPGGPGAGTAPEQIHTAVAGAARNGDATGLSIAWYTQQQTASSQVQFGRSPTALSSTVRGGSASYLENWGFHHDVELVGLTPSAEYYYRCGDGATWSSVHKIVAPYGSASNASFSMAVFGDMGYLGSDERPMVITIDGEHGRL